MAEIKRKNTNKNKKTKPVKTVRQSNIPQKETKKSEEIFYYFEGMTIEEVALRLGVSNSEIIKKLMMQGIMANLNQTIDRETIEMIVLEYDKLLEDQPVTDISRFDEIEFVDDDGDLVTRPPVVTIMGHVDHGKTTLLDTIRHSKVTATEAGGITQHIGAYQVKKNGKFITFIDTPGHAAFTKMRARGAEVTDITILVVAADDGVMPQTREAIDHSNAANVPIIVAVNKIDVPGSNPDKVKQELTELGLVPEEWGGDTIYCMLSALKGEGIDNLLEMIQLTAELQELKANPKRLGSGSVIESKLDKGRGPVATLLVSNGSINVGDVVACGDTFGKVRAMINDHGSNINTCGPSDAVEVLGLNDVPQAGDSFMVFDDEKKARLISEKRAHRTWQEELGVGKAINLDELFSQINDGNIKEIRVILKCDTNGSAEALKGSLLGIEVEGAKVNVIRSSVGTITETDVSLAIASGAVIIGFNVRPIATVRELAKEKGIDLRLYNIIYNAIDELEKAMTGLLDPEFKEVVTGQAEVRNLFKVSKIGTIAGCYVTEGSIKRDSLVRVLREGIVVYEGDMSTLKRFKDDVKEVREGFECGITIDKYNDIKEGDVIEASIMEEVKR